ncbi:MAG: two-component regulator propeller domain-containing protein [Bacteroidota bacterium]
MALVMLTGWLWWSPQPALAHSGNNNLGIPFIQNYDRETYGAGTQNWSIIQDSRQLIYVANNNGLLEYDGSNWTCYPLANRTICRSVAQDERGRIFAGGQGEIGFFEPDASGRLTYHSLLDKIAEPYRQFTDVWQIVVRGQLVHFRASDRLYTLQQDTITVADDQAIRFMGLAGDRLFAQNTAGELLLWDTGGWEVVTQNTAVSERLITAVLPYRGDTVVFTTLKGGLYRFDGNTAQEWTTSYSNYLKENRTYCAIPLGENRYAFGTSRGGLLIAEKSGRLIHRLTKRNDLQNNNILSLQVDRDGNLWLGLDNGIDFVEVSSPFNRLYPDGELTGTAYTALVHDQKIYFGTNNGLY